MIRNTFNTNNIYTLHKNIINKFYIKEMNKVYFLSNIKITKFTMS